ncbi:MAG: hypothetical protein AABZ30_00105, partial [Myxococcota bacterium]
MLARIARFDERRLAPGLRQPWLALVEAVAAAQRRDTDATLRIARAPGISSLVACLHDPARASPCAAELVPLLAFQLA